MSASSGIFDVNKQLTFYGAYHSNKVNVLIHMICVPMIVWTGQVMGTKIGMPAFLPKVHYKFNDYLQFDLNAPAIQGALYLAYYYCLEPVAAALYTPQMVLSVLTATSYATKQGAVSKALVLHLISWIAQFIGHGVAEKRAPALLDNLLGAVVLAPFFVHLEMLFGLGYRPKLHKHLQNEIGKEIARIRKIEGDKRRAQQQKDQ
jgi:uncharacterized membrane protein YGL010W